MKVKNIKQSAVFHCIPDKAYSAWLDSKIHGDMIGGTTKIDPRVGGKFAIWDGSIVGQTLELNSKTRRVVQNWRYDNWPKDYFSKITIEFMPDRKDKTKINFTQTGIPEEFAKDIEQGWKDYYWEPMKKYFEEKG